MIRECDGGRSICSQEELGETAVTGVVSSAATDGGEAEIHFEVGRRILAPSLWAPALPSTLERTLLMLGDWHLASMLPSMYFDEGFDR